MRTKLISFMLVLWMSLTSDAQARSNEEITQHLAQARQSLVLFRASHLTGDQSQDYLSAILHYRDSLALMRAKPDHPEHLAAALEFARLLVSQKQWIDAANYYGRAAALLEKSGSKDFAVLAEVSARIAFAHLQSQVLGLAMVHARESLQYCARLSEQQAPCMVAAKRVLADASFSLSDYPQAASLYQLLAQADERTYSSDQVTGSNAYFLARYWQSQVRSRAWNADQAQQALQALDDLLPHVSCAQLVEACRELRQAGAELARLTGDLNLANQRIRFALSQREPVLPLSNRPSREWVLAAQIQLERGELEQARTSLIHALADIGDPYAERAQKMRTLALYYQKKGMSKHEIFWLKRTSVWALYAARHYRLSDPKTGRIFLAAQSEVFHRLSRLLLEQKRLVEALDILDLYKENQFLDYSGELPNVMRSAPHSEHGMRWKLRYYADTAKVSEKIGRSEWGHLYQLSEQESEQKAQFKKTLANSSLSEQNQQERVAIFQQFLDDFEADYAGDHAIVPDEESEQVLAQKRAMLKHPRSALLEYLVSEDKLYIVLLSKEKTLRSYGLDITAKKLKQWIHLHRQATLTKHDTRIVAKALYRVLIQPVIKELKRLNIQEILIFPDAELQALSFAALYDGQRYLVQDYATKVVNQTEQVEHPKSESKAVASVFGNTLASEELPDLPAVGTEAKALAQLFKTNGKKLVLYLDQDFDLQAFENAVHERHHILHIASHYKHQAGQHEDSYFLTGTNTPLSLGKIKALTQDYSFAEMISLSACDTDVSAQTQYGIDAEGIGSVLVRRGAKAVLATKWEVNDSGSALLMPRFYRAWLAGQSKAQALRSAQLSLLKLARAQGEQSTSRGVRLAKSAAQLAENSRRYPYAHPYYWAGFVLLER